MRLSFLLGLLGCATAAVVSIAGNARACGACFVSSQNATVVTDHRMVFSVSPTQTTLYDQIQYTGSPESFAWVLPVHGQVTVGVSSDRVFQALDQATQTTILAPQRPPCPSCNCGVKGNALFVGDGGSGVPGVTVTSRQVVGPYETVQLHPNSQSDTAALTSWLAVNGYNLPADFVHIIAAYVFGGSDFLALKLAPGQGVQAMRPVSVTTPGAGLTLPLRMVAAGTGATVGITLWVIATGRYEPQNFAHFVISAADLVWDWSTKSSNYTTLRTKKEAGFYNAAWQVESSVDVWPGAIENVVLQGDPPASDYAPPSAPDGGNASQVDADAGGLTPVEARSQDLMTLLPTQSASVRITRLRADLSQAALANDLSLQASGDQTALSNTYQATKSVNDSAACPACPCGLLGCSTPPAPISPDGETLATFAALLGFGTAYRLARRSIRGRALPAR